MERKAISKAILTILILYAQVHLAGAESDTFDKRSDFLFSDEYIKLVEWNANTNLEKVIVTYTDEDNNKHTVPATLKDGKYVLYVSDTIKSVDQINAVTEDVYAKGILQSLLYPGVQTSL